MASSAERGTSLRHPSPRPAARRRAALLVHALAAATSPIEDPDVFWVAAAGREMLADARVLRENLFSFTEPARPWVMHEWLFGVPYALGLDRLGPSFFALAALASLGATASLLLLHTLRGRAGVLGARSSPSSRSRASRSAWAPRPSGVALFFAVALTALAFRRRFTPALAVLAVAVEVLWANAHGSFPLGVAILAAAAACVTEWPWAYARARSRRPPRRRSSTPMASPCTGSSSTTFAAVERSTPSTPASPTSRRSGATRACSARPRSSGWCS